MYVRTLFVGKQHGLKSRSMRANQQKPWQNKAGLHFRLDKQQAVHIFINVRAVPSHLASQLCEMPHLSCVRCQSYKQNFPSHRHITKRGKQVLGRWTSRRAVCWWFAGGRRRLWLRRRRRRRRRWWRRGRLGHWLLQLPLPLNQGHWLRQRGKSRDHLLLFDPLLEVAVAKVSCRL